MSVNEIGKIVEASPHDIMRTYELLGLLLQDEASSVTLLAANPDGPPDFAIKYVGPASIWPERFEGETLLACLETAYAWRSLRRRP